MWQYLDAAVAVFCAALASPFASVRQQAYSGAASAALAALHDVTDVSHGQRVLSAVLPPLVTALGAAREAELRGVAAEAVCEVTQAAWDSTSDGRAVTVAQALPLPARADDDESPLPHTPAVVPVAVLPAMYDVIRDVFKLGLERRQASAAELTANPDADQEDLDQFAGE